MDKEFKINNHTDMDVNGLSGEITRLYPYAKEKLGFDKPVIINLLSDPKNSKNIFGKTAQYSPSDMTIDIFVDGRHPKDILRSLSHELVHHSQNCRGDFDNLDSTGEGYAQKNPFLRKLEAEAYLLGNGLLFRDFEDMRKSKMKTNENKFNLRDMIRGVLKETFNNTSIEEDAYEDEPMEEGEEQIEAFDEAKLPKNWRSLPTNHPARVAFRKKYRARGAKRSAKRKSGGPKVARTMNFSDKEGSVITAKPRKGREMKFSDKEGSVITARPSKRRRRKGQRSSDKMSNLAKLLKLTEPEKMFAKKGSKPKGPRSPDAMDAAMKAAGVTKKDRQPGYSFDTKKIAGKGEDAKIAKTMDREVEGDPGANILALMKNKGDEKPKRMTADPVKDQLREAKNNVDNRNDKEWYNDTLFENLVKKWTK